MTRAKIEVVMERTFPDRDDPQASRPFSPGGLLTPILSNHTQGSSNSESAVAQDNTDIFSQISGEALFTRLEALKKERQCLILRFQQDWKLKFLSGLVPEIDHNIGNLSNADLGALYQQHPIKIHLYIELRDDFENAELVDSRVVLRDEVPIVLPLYLYKTYRPFALNPSKMMAKRLNAVHAEEKADVEVMYAQLSTYVETGKKLQALRGRLAEGGKAVKEAQGPMHSNTSDEEIMIRNAEGIHANIDKILEPGQDRGKEERIIRAGIAKIGLTEYMASLKRLDRALTQMQKDNIRANQEAIGDCNELLHAGRHNLEEFFRSKLRESCKPVEPLHYITKDLPFPVIPPEKTSQLEAMEKSIATTSAREAASSQRESPSVRIYSDCRGAYLAGSLQSLSIASISTSKRKNVEEPYRSGTSAIGTYASAIEGLFLAELQNISNVFPREDWGIAIEITTRKALADLAKTLRELNMYIKQNMTTDCFLAYEILEKVTKVGQRVNSSTGDIKLPFAEALKPIRETAKAAIPDQIEDQRRRITDMQLLPPNGSTTPFTTETLKRLQFLTETRTSLASLLASLGEGTWLQPPSTHNQPSASLRTLDVGADGTALLSTYILDTLDVHVRSLESRATALYKSKAVHGVFLSNTVATIDKMIRSSDLASLLSDNPTAQSKLDSWRKRGTSIYMDSWREPSSALFDVQYTNRSGPRPHSGSAVASAEVIKSLSSKDKDAIKEKWKLFNSSFDECVKRHREMSGGMEREVKSNLSREVGNMVEPLYARFWDRYEALDRGRGKYVKYDKGQLSAILASLG